MKNLDILVPFSLLEKKTASCLINICKAPALATLLTRNITPVITHTYNNFFRSLPHEDWTARQLGLPVSKLSNISLIDRGDSPPIATTILLNLHIQKYIEGYWFILQPVHFHVARNHLLLMLINELELTDIESRQFFCSAHKICTEQNYILLYVDAQTWLLRADNFVGLRTSSPLAVSGRKIDIWMPTGPGEKSWRKLQNEIQMQWFKEKLNKNRENSGHKTVNSVWLWGGSNTVATNNISYQSFFNLKGWQKNIITQSKNSKKVDDILLDPAQNSLLILDTLIEPTLTGAWDIWLENFEKLNHNWFYPILKALNNKQIKRLSFILSNFNTLKQVTITSSSIKFFWRISTLKKLIT